MEEFELDQQLAMIKPFIIPTVQCNTPEYKTCSNSQGVCVDSNGDSQADQCICPPFLSKRKPNMYGWTDGHRMDGGEAISHDTNWSSMNVILEKQVRSDRDSPAVNTDLECSMPLAIALDGCEGANQETGGKEEVEKKAKQK
ncbi:hypothetical protein SprV_0602231900 [Sparganum proliferum]